MNGLPGRPVAEGTDLIAGGLKHVTNHWVYPLPVSVAERVGFEPTVAITTPVFKTGAFNRSATSP